MSTAAPTIAEDVTVTLDDRVARELLSLGGVVEGDLPSWRLPDGTQTTDPQAALAARCALSPTATAPPCGTPKRSPQSAAPSACPAGAQPSRARRHGAKR
jgi:hypothetical protein